MHSLLTLMQLSESRYSTADMLINRVQHLGFWDPGAAGQSESAKCLAANSQPTVLRQLSSMVLLAAALSTLSACNKKPEEEVEAAVEERAEEVAQDVARAIHEKSRMEWAGRADAPGNLREVREHRHRAVAVKGQSADCDEPALCGGASPSFEPTSSRGMETSSSGMAKLKEPVKAWRRGGGGVVTFSVIDDVLVGDVHAASGKLYSIRYVAKGVSLVEELDPEKFPPEESADVVRGDSSSAVSATPIPPPNAVGPAFRLTPTPPATPQVDGGRRRPNRFNDVGGLANALARDREHQLSNRSDIIARTMPSDAKKTHSEGDTGPVAGQIQLDPSAGSGTVGLRHNSVKRNPKYRYRGGLPGCCRQVSGARKGDCCKN